MSSPKSPGFCGEIWRIASDDFCEHQPLMLTKCSQNLVRIFVCVKFTCHGAHSLTCSSILNLDDDGLTLFAHIGAGDKADTRNPDAKVDEEP